jgi:hypothetical protein
MKQDILMKNNSTHACLSFFARYDNRLVDSFLEHFPEFDDNAHLSKVTDDDLKTPAAKHKWRTFMKEWEKEVGKYLCS